MTGPALENLLSMLRGGRDNALLRYALGNEFLKAGDAASAAEHLRAAVGHDPHYSAAWKQLGRALESSGDLRAAAQAWRQGVRVANARGDKQAAREMALFARRAERGLEHK